jgi:hypothetical protein
MQSNRLPRVETRREVIAYLRQFQESAKTQCSAVHWRDHDGVPHNGTMTFLRTSKCVLGITNRHVADAIEGLDDDTRVVLQLGGARFSPNRLIAMHPNLDLATFELSDVMLATAGAFAASVTNWPPPLPCEEDYLILGGYPAVYRNQRESEIDFYFTSFIGKINCKPGRNISMVLDIENGTSLSNHRIETTTPLGGCSGGPVFRYVDSGYIERMELTGIIHESNEGSDYVLAHDLTSLNEDGTFSSDVW